MLLSIAYDGRSYHGFAPQPGQLTVSSALLEALASIDPAIDRLHGCSRTDRGVHARDQRAIFTPSKALPLTAWTHGANGRLPASISIRKAWRVPDEFFPRGHVVSKTYRYTLLLDEMRDPFFDGVAWRLTGLTPAAAVAAMSTEAQSVVGTHRFGAFRGAQDEREDPTRTLFQCAVTSAPHDDRIVWIDVTGSGFLYHMVRIIVGAMVDVARGRLDPGAFTRALESGDRRTLGITAPPDGLCLHSYDLRGIDSAEPVFEDFSAK